MMSVIANPSRQLLTIKGRSILLLSCYEMGHQPLGLASPRGFLTRAGYPVETIDLAVEPLNEAQVAGAWFVGISVPMHTALRLGVRAAERIRESNPACHICFYGLYASLNAEYLLETTADSVIGGEFEESLVRLVKALRRKEEEGRWKDSLPHSRHPSADSELPPLSGVSLRGEQPSQPDVRRLSYAVPDRRGLPKLDRYAHLELAGARHVAGYVEASRGCLHRCLHCPIPPVYGGRFFAVPRDTVLADIRQLVDMGARHITFGDPDFLNGPGHSRELVKAMRDEFNDLTFDMTAKVEHLLKYRSILKEFAQSGCAFVVSAAESLSDAVLAILEKGHTRADVYTALEVVREAGLALRPTWVPFTPWSTLDDYIDIVEFVHTKGLISHVDPVQYSIRLLIPPGSSLLERSAIDPYLGPLDRSGFSYQWTHPDPRMDVLQKTVSAAVEEAARLGEDPMITFHRVRELAYAARGGYIPSFMPSLAGGLQEMSPRLTEPWFC